MKQRKVALAKGRLADKAIALFEKAGYDVSGLVEDSRMLIFQNKELSFLMVKPTDVPVYVEHGVADFGICGKDTLLERGAHIYEMMDLGYGKCKLSLAGKPGTDTRQSGLKVATKYTHFAKEFFRKRGQAVEIIPLYGSVELGPITGLSDIILDIVESGKTLKENGLVVLEDIVPISARLVVNRVSLKLNAPFMQQFIKNVQAALEEEA